MPRMRPPRPPQHPVFQQPRRPGQLEALIICSDQEWAIACGLTLARDRFAPRWVANAEEALGFLDCYSPPLIFVTPNLPDIPARELLRKLQRLPGSPPATVLCAPEHDELSIRRGLDVASEYFCTKNSWDDFLLLVQRLLQRLAPPPAATHRFH